MTFILWFHFDHEMKISNHDKIGCTAGRVFSLKPKTRLTNDNSGKLILSGALLYSEFKKIGFVILRTCSRLK